MYVKIEVVKVLRIKAGDEVQPSITFFGWEYTGMNSQKKFFHKIKFNNLKTQKKVVAPIVTYGRRKYMTSTFL